MQRQLPYFHLECRMSAVNFAGRLKELRVRAGLTQDGLAERAALSKAGIADLEQGRREPSWATVVALAKALGVTCQAFLEEAATTEKAKPGRPQKAPDSNAARAPDQETSGREEAKPGTKRKRKG
jgi:transcriptional regulator with XRE-family HTH domain